MEYIRRYAMDAIEKGLIEVKDNTDKGYHPMVYFEGWRVAYLNEIEKFHLEKIDDLQRHNTSDETFILLEGKCTIYIGDGGDGEPGHITPVPLEAGKMYNIKKGVWHTHALSEGARVIVIENADVSDANSDHLAVKLTDIL